MIPNKKRGAVWTKASRKRRRDNAKVKNEKIE